MLFDFFQVFGQVFLRNRHFLIQRHFRKGTHIDGRFLTHLIFYRWLGLPRTEIPGNDAGADRRTEGRHFPLHPKSVAHGTRQLLEFLFVHFRE